MHISFGRVFCALGDGMTSPIVSSLEYFRDEYVEHIRLGRCPFGVTEPRRDIGVVEFTVAGGYEAIPPATPEAAGDPSDTGLTHARDDRARRVTT